MANFVLEEFVTHCVFFFFVQTVTTRNTEIETQLLYAFAKTDRLADLEEFVSGPNTAKVGDVGDNFARGRVLHRETRIGFYLSGVDPTVR